jgi:hypothetical protein
MTCFYWEEEMLNTCELYWCIARSNKKLHTDFKQHWNLLAILRKRKKLKLYVYIYTRTHTYAHTYIHRYNIHIYIHTHIYAHAYIHTCIHIHTYIRTYVIHIYKHTQIHIYIHIYTHTYAHIYICTYIIHTHNVCLKSNAIGAIHFLLTIDLKINTPSSIQFPLEATNRRRHSHSRYQGCKSSCGLSRPFGCCP